MEVMVRDVRLWGSLGDKFGHHHRLAVSTPGEAMRAIDANRPGFLAFIGKMHDDGIAFACFIGDENIDEEGLGMPLGAESFEIAPVIRGAGENAGVWEVIAGVVLIAAALFLGPPGWVIGGVGLGWLGGGTALFIGMTGFSLAMAGISNLIAPKPGFDVGQDEKDKSRPSTFFSGAVNTVAQGQPIPVLLGEMYCGSATISLGVSNRDRTKEEMLAGL